MGKLRNLNIILFSMKRVIFNFILFSKGKQYATVTLEPTLKGIYSEKQLFLWPTTKALRTQAKACACKVSIHWAVSGNLTNDFWTKTFSPNPCLFGGFQLN